MPQRNDVPQSCWDDLRAGGLGRYEREDPPCLDAPVSLSALMDQMTPREVRDLIAASDSRLTASARTKLLLLRQTREAS